MINRRLATQLELSEQTISDILHHHSVREFLESEMQNTTDREELKLLSKDWTNNEFDLQDLWGFPRDENYHRWWYVPRCTCPKIDNDDAYGTGYYTRTLDCPVHGD